MDPAAETYSSQFPAQLHDTENSSAADHQHGGDEAPAVKGKVHQFYLVKLHPYEDPELESKIKGMIRTINEARASPIRRPKMDRGELRRPSSYWYYTGERWYWYWDWSWEEWRARELIFLQQSLRKLSFVDDCEKQAKELKRRLVHAQGSGQANEERKIFKELNDLIRTKELAESDSSRAEEIAEIVKRWGSKDEIRQQIQKLQLPSGWTRVGIKENELKRYQKRLAAMEKDHLAWEAEQLDLNQKKAKAYECILDLNKLQAKIRADYDEYVATSNAVKELALKKDIKGLEELINGANERFMSKWGKEKGFRQVYKKRVVSSLDSRGLNLDGTLKNPGED